MPISSSTSPVFLITTRLSPSAHPVNLLFLQVLPLCLDPLHCIPTFLLHTHP
jgi:hypothetical protein